MNYSSKKILLSGSLVYDYIFSIHGNIRDKIILESGSIKALDLLFTASNLEKRFGGTAGNIAYGLKLLGSEPVVFSVVGHDFPHEYGTYLKKLKIENILHYDPNGHTATYYGISDQTKEMIAVFQPNLHDSIGNFKLSDYLPDWKDVSVAIFSAGTAQSITRHIKETRLQTKRIRTILDPGPIINFFPPELFIEALINADYLIINEVEKEIITNKHGTSDSKILDSGVEAIVVTLAEKGARIITNTDEKIIPAKAVTGNIEPTGAGDAFRAGFAHAINTGLSLPDAVVSGNRLAAACLKVAGGQGYTV